MNDISTLLLLGFLVLLIMLSGFFSGSETALMTLNRYRMRHLAQQGHRGAQRASRLLERPDRLIGLILLGNNFVNILASSIATLLALRLMGEAGIAVATGLLTLVVLIFAEVAPKTLAAMKPERLAYPAATVYTPLLTLLYPLVWMVNLMANTVLRLLGANPHADQDSALSREELRTVVAEAGSMIPHSHREMLLSILDLDNARISDIMIPRSAVHGIDFDDPIEEILEDLANTQYTRIPLYEGSLDNIIGILHTRKTLNTLMQADEVSRDDLRRLAREPYFIPESTPLTRQLLNFRKESRRVAFVVDEYGDIQGLTTMEDILEEIVGEFTTDPAAGLSEVRPQTDGSYLVDGSTHLRELNRSMGWQLPTDGAKTLSGLITEQLQSIPETGTSVRIGGYPIEIVQTKDNVVRVARIQPKLRRKD